MDRASREHPGPFLTYHPAPHPSPVLDVCLPLLPAIACQRHTEIVPSYQELTKERLGRRQNVLRTHLLLFVDFA